MNTNSGTLPQKAIAGYSGSYSGIFKTMHVTENGQMDGVPASQTHSGLSSQILPIPY